MLSSNSLASITTSSGAGPKPDKSDDRTRAVAVPIRRVPTDVGATPSRYGEKRKFNLPAAALTLLLSAALLAALVQNGTASGWERVCQYGKTMVVGGT